MTLLTGTGPQVVSQGLFVDSADQLHDLGALTHSNDGRAFRYCKAGGTALVAGNLQQAPAEDTGDQDVAIAAASAGDKEIVTTGNLTVTANQYAGGFVAITTSAGKGYNYKIDSHAAASGAVVTFKLVDEIQVALTTSSKIDLIKNPYDGVILNPTTPSSAPKGVAVIALTEDQFGWLQVRGPAVVEAEGAVAVGAQLVASDGDAGCVEATADGANELDAHVGVALAAADDGEFGFADLHLL